jgi:cell division protein FtsB
LRWLLVAPLCILLYLQQTAINTELRERNAILEREVLELQSGNGGVEQRAREQLGLVREGETFYQVVEQPDQPQAEPETTR